MSLINGDTQSGNRPGCWGRVDIYDSENRECRGCGFQSTCKSQVIKTTQANQQTVPQVSQLPYGQPPYQYQTQPQPYSAPQQQALRLPVPFTPPQVPYAPVAQAPQPYAAPMRIPVIPATPVPQQPQYHQPQVQQIPQMQMAAPQDVYGRIQDPLFFPIMNSPPFRPQMPGESFGERILKNILLDAGTMAAFHIGLALRQMVLPPVKKEPEEKIINQPK